MKSFSFLLGPEKEEFRKGKGVGVCGVGKTDRKVTCEEKSRERQKTNAQAWTQRRGEELRESEISTERGPPGARGMNTQRTSHMRRGKRGKGE